MIRSDIKMPCPQVYSSRFGGLKQAYEMIGYEPTRNLTHFERDRSLKPARRNFNRGRTRSTGPLAGGLPWGPWEARGSIRPAPRFRIEFLLAIQ
jgi:hypothetical protein